MDPFRARPEFEDIYRRAIADPQSTTRAERNAILGFPPPEEEDRVCVSMTGHTIAELQAKALSNPDDLNRDEATILWHPTSVYFREFKNVTEKESRERRERHRQRCDNPSPLELLQDEAQRSVKLARGEKETAVIKIGMQRMRAIDEAKLWPIRQRDQAEYRAYRLRGGTMWIQQILENGLLENGAECWGFVVFRTGCYRKGEEGEAAWARFREHFESMAKASVLHYNDGPKLLPSLRTVFVDDDKTLEGASDEVLRAKFREMRDGEEDRRLPKGIRTSCFLVADRAAIKCEAAQTPFSPRYIDDIEASFYIRKADPVVYIQAIDPDFQAPRAVEEKAKGKGEDERRGEDEAKGNEAGTSSTGAPTSTAEGKSKAEVLQDEMAGFQGQATVALPRVFDWLHLICFGAERGFDIPSSKGHEGWHAIYMQTKTPEGWVRRFPPHWADLVYSEEMHLLEGDT